MVNGGPDYTEIGTLTVDDIETVEIYDLKQLPRTADRQPRPFGGSQRFGTGEALMPISNGEKAAWANSTKTCAVVYVWLR